MEKKTVAQISYFPHHACQSPTSGTRMDGCVCVCVCVCVHTHVHTSQGGGQKRQNKTNTQKTTSYKTITYGTNYYAIPQDSIMMHDFGHWCLCLLWPEYPARPPSSALVGQTPIYPSNTSFRANHSGKPSLTSAHIGHHCVPSSVCPASWIYRWLELADLHCRLVVHGPVYNVRYLRAWLCYPHGLVEWTFRHSTSIC